MIEPVTLIAAIAGALLGLMAGRFCRVTEGADYLEGYRAGRQSALAEREPLEFFKN